MATQTATRPSSKSASRAAPRPRAYWKGVLRLSLVSIPVELFAATTSADHPTLHQIHKPSGKRVRYEKVVPGIGPIDTSDIVKGFEIDRDRYVLLEPDEIDEIKLETKRTIELVQFVDHCEIDPRYFDRPYYIVPEGDVAAEGYLVMHDALKAAKKVGLGQLTLRGREYVVAIKPCGRGLMLETLRYADEVRSAETFFEDLPDLKLDKEMVNLAGELIGRKSKPFDATVFNDSYADSLRELVERKRKGKAVVTAEDSHERASSGNVVDLMEALKKSVGGKKSSSRSIKGRSGKTERAKKRA
jgi:DNA end-binding protein Ku